MNSKLPMTYEEFWAAEKGWGAPKEGPEYVFGQKAWDAAIKAERADHNTELGRKLLEIRNRAIGNGMRLLTCDEINAEVAEQRGQHNDGA